MSVSTEGRLTGRRSISTMASATSRASQSSQGCSRSQAMWRFQLFYMVVRHVIQANDRTRCMQPGLVSPQRAASTQI